ncbi:MAG: hypothetical protein J3R72DRAFT_250710 [Linnemannia gamsii]|nr:MAG: hypothetical protein J3R72DRAFT_250710 [Linnemannia gamsii]
MAMAPGIFKVASPGTDVLAIFVIDKKTYTFQGAFGGVSIEPCDGMVTLTFASLSDLIDTQHFSGVIGISTAKIALANGVEISGSLNNPITIANSIVGVGRWSSVAGS